MEAGAADLRQTLAEVSTRIGRHRGSRIGEQNTKATLIVPVLRALGWDVEDLDEVHLEFKTRPQDKPVDYALMIQRKPVLFIEAKGLDEDLNDRRWATQIISYAAVAGVEWVVLTNGDTYRIYAALAAVALDEKLFRAVQISDDASEAADALALLTKDDLRSRSLDALWRAQSIDKRVQKAVHDLFEPEPSAWLVGRITRSVEGLKAGDVRAALARARVTLDFPAAESGVPELPKPQSAQPAKKQKGAPAARYGVSLKNLLDAGLLKPGTQLHRDGYLGQNLTATVEADGKVRVGSEIYNSLSVAAGAARVTVKGKPPDGRSYYQTNGWDFWHFIDGEGKQQPMEALRKQYLSRS